MIKKIGIIGAGQLALMLVQAAQEFGVECICLDANAFAPAFKYCKESIVAQFDDEEAIKDLSNRVDTIIYEFENVPLCVLEKIDKNKLFQGKDVLRYSQNRILEKNLANESGIPTVEFSSVRTEEELNKELEKIGFPAILKTQELGYDGKGQVLIKSEEDLIKAKDLLTSKCILESKLDFDYELSSIAVYSPNGDFQVFPIFKNNHVNGILHQTIIDEEIEIIIQNKIKKHIEELMKKNNFYGILCIEFFIKGTDVYFNEMAPRPHNSGHITLDATTVSQFEQMIRSVCGFKLLKANIVKPMMMINILGQHMEIANNQLKESEVSKVYLYGKDKAIYNRKMGHINIELNEVNTINKILEEFDELSR